MEVTFDRSLWQVSAACQGGMGDVNCESAGARYNAGH